MVAVWIRISIGITLYEVRPNAMSSVKQDHHQVLIFQVVQHNRHIYQSEKKKIAIVQQTIGITDNVSGMLHTEGSGPIGVK